MEGVDLDWGLVRGRMGRVLVRGRETVEETRREGARRRYRGVI